MSWREVDFVTTIWNCPACGGRVKTHYDPKQYHPPENGPEWWYCPDCCAMSTTADCSSYKLKIYTLGVTTA